MQPTESIASLTDRSPLSASTCAQLAYAFRRAAQDTGLSGAATDRYQAWAMAFVSWCQDTAPHHVGPDRIGTFERALRERTGLEKETVHEALDALAFLFGAVETVESILPSGGSTQEERRRAELGAPSQVDREGPAGETIQSLRIGWQDETDPDDAPSSSVYPGAQCAPEPAKSECTTDDENVERPSAKMWIKRYQSQLASVHTPKERTAEAPEMPTATPEADLCSA